MADPLKDRLRSSGAVASNIQTYSSELEVFNTNESALRTITFTMPLNSSGEGLSILNIGSLVKIIDVKATQLGTIEFHSSKSMDSLSPYRVDFLSPTDDAVVNYRLTNYGVVSNKDATPNKNVYVKFKSAVQAENVEITVKYIRLTSEVIANLLTLTLKVPSGYALDYGFRFKKTIQDSFVVLNPYDVSQLQTSQYEKAIDPSHSYFDYNNFTYSDYQFSSSANIQEFSDGIYQILLKPTSYSSPEITHPSLNLSQSNLQGNLGTPMSVKYRLSDGVTGYIDELTLSTAQEDINKVSSSVIEFTIEYGMIKIPPHIVQVTESLVLHA